MAQKIVENEWLDLRKISINFLHKPQDKIVYETLHKEFSDATKVDYIFHTWMTYLRDALLVQGENSGELYNQDIENYVRIFAAQKNVVDVLEALPGAREDYGGNVDKNLILENLSLTLGA